MAHPVIFIFVVCMYVCVVHAAQCPDQTDAWKLLQRRQSKRYFLVKTTSVNLGECSYLKPGKIDEATQSASFSFGLRDKPGKSLTTQSAMVKAQGEKLVVTGDSQGTTTVLFSDYGSCDVLLGPDGDCELWAHEAVVRSSSLGCCDTKFQACAKKKKVRHTYQENCPRG
uniref:Lipocalin-like protein n=1 Tax=Ornithodoros turicata TaxID=34597 RepID=A0A248T5D5_9ACAR|nr:lipocalin-like protein [Ornithodoros turicata]